jgi:hypothetical protein
MKLGYMYHLIDSAKRPNHSITVLNENFSRHNNNINVPCGWNYMDEQYANWGQIAFIAILKGELKQEIKGIIECLIKLGENLEM